jgi:hypothetical protein
MGSKVDPDVSRHFPQTLLAKLRDILNKPPPLLLIRHLHSLLHKLSKAVKAALLIYK